MGLRTHAASLALVAACSLLYRDRRLMQWACCATVYIDSGYSYCYIWIEFFLAYYTRWAVGIVANHKKLLKASVCLILVCFYRSPFLHPLIADCVVPITICFPPYPTFNCRYACKKRSLFVGLIEEGLKLFAYTWMHIDIVPYGLRARGNT